MKQLLVCSVGLILLAISCSQKSPMSIASVTAATSRTSQPPDTLPFRRIPNDSAKIYVEDFAYKVITLGQKKIPRMIWFTPSILKIMSYYDKAKIVYGLNRDKKVITIVQVKYGKNLYYYYEMPGYDNNKKRSPETSFCPEPYPCSVTEFLEPVE